MSVGLRDRVDQEENALGLSEKLDAELKIVFGEDNVPVAQKVEDVSEMCPISFRF